MAMFLLQVVWRGDKVAKTDSTAAPVSQLSQCPLPYITYIRKLDLSHPINTFSTLLEVDDVASIRIKKELKGVH